MALICPLAEVALVTLRAVAATVFGWRQAIPESLSATHNKAVHRTAARVARADATAS
jgi:hypothetical protein